MVTLTIHGDGVLAPSGRVEATANHPIWVANRGTWVDAGKVQIGDLLRTASGTYAPVTTVRAYTASAPVYNLTVAGVHTYYVAAGPMPVLAHNCGDGILAPGPFAGNSIPARGPARDFTPDERNSINEIGRTSGCHRCGATTSGTKSGNFVPDHQPASAVNPPGAAQRLYPHCITCSRVQGGVIRSLKQKGVI
ncbi:Hint domain-containing protein [Luteipulveratus flavus]|uniref:Hint domain-containing protein n=1 Tax=Luteipulveratus flavus TaxID=3031728 RepID=UPI003907FE70